MAAAARGAAVAVIIKDPGGRDRTAHAAGEAAVVHLIWRTSSGAARIACVA